MRSDVLKIFSDAYKRYMQTLFTSQSTLHATNEWIVDCKSVGSGSAARVYLGRYLYREMIQERDIVACENGQVNACHQ